MSEWRRMTLQEVCVEAEGNIQTGPFGSQLHASDYVDSGVPVVMPVNIGENVLLSSGIAMTSDRKARGLSRHLLITGDIVYSRRGDVKRRALVRAPQTGWLCGTGCLRVRIKDHSKHDPAFISYALGLTETRNWISQHAVGATMLNLNTQILAAVPLRVPSMSKQRAIVEVLGVLDDKIAANDRMVITADRLADALTRAAANGRMARLDGLAHVTMGSSPPGESYNEARVGAVFYQGIRDFGVRYPTNRVWTTSPVRLAGVGDTLISVRAPVGRTNVAAEDTCIGRGLAAARSTSSCPWSLFHLLRFDPSIWAPFEAEGTVFGSITKEQLASVRIPMIEPSRSSTLECELQALEGRIASAFAENHQLSLTRDTLLSLLMSGKIRVKDAEDAVQGVL